MPIHGDKKVARLYAGYGSRESLRTPRTKRGQVAPAPMMVIPVVYRGLISCEPASRQRAHTRIARKNIFALSLLRCVAARLVILSKVAPELGLLVESNCTFHRDIPRQQFGNAFDRMIGNAQQHLSQVGFWI